MKQITRLMTTGSLATLVTLSGLSTPVIAETPRFVAPEEYRVSLNWNIPRADENWDGGLGILAQAVFPADFIPHMPDQYRITASLGINTWNANEDSRNISAGAASGGTGQLSGNSRSITIGGSFLRSDTLPMGLELTSEVGLQYQSISSDTDLVVTQGSTPRSPAELDIDDSLLVVLGVYANHKANEELTIFGGLGYQFDLGAGDASAFSDEVSNYTNAITLRGGIRF